MKKIFFLYHVRERELKILNYIEECIYKKYRKCIIKKGGFYSSIADVIAFKPDIIVSIPPRDDYSANYLTVFKLLTNATIISMVTEGYYPDDEKKISEMVGYNKYSYKLVDRYIVWGPKTKNKFGDILLNLKRVSDLSRIKITGYCFYETQLVQQSYSEIKKLETVRKKHKKYKKNVLVLTGFQTASLTVELLVLMSIFGNKTKNELNEKELEYATSLIETTKNYREKSFYLIVGMPTISTPSRYLYLSLRFSTSPLF